jgi:hypothetical protein
MPKHQTVRCEEKKEDAIEKKRVFQDFPPSFILRV